MINISIRNVAGNHDILNFIEFQLVAVQIFNLYLRH